MGAEIQHHRHDDQTGREVAGKESQSVTSLSFQHPVPAHCISYALILCCEFLRLQDELLPPEHCCADSAFKG